MQLTYTYNPLELYVQFIRELDHVLPHEDPEKHVMLLDLLACAEDELREGTFTLGSFWSLVKEFLDISPDHGVVIKPEVK